jgi:SAM-dependent methyltransferase
MKQTSEDDMSSRVINAYDAIAASHVYALEGVYREYYERPVMQALLGNVHGKRVLDAGCGSGSFSEWLIAQGAEVLAIDASPKMVQLTRKRIGDAAQVLHVDLDATLDFIAAASLDIVLAALVLDYIRDWDTLFMEFGRVLTASGRLVFSVHHPYFLDLKVNANVEEPYFGVQTMEEDWRPFGLTIPAYRRPLGAMAASLWHSGFLIEQIVEPQPTEECRAAYPEHYERLSKHPVFICFSASKSTRD